MFLLVIAAHSNPILSMRTILTAIIATALYVSGAMTHGNPPKRIFMLDKRRRSNGRTQTHLWYATQAPMQSFYPKTAGSSIYAYESIEAVS